MTSTVPQTVDVAALIALLDAFWEKQMSHNSLISEPFDLGPAMDSLTACSVNAEVEDLLGINPLPVSLIKCGGYESKAEFLTHYKDGLTDYLKK